MSCSFVGPAVRCLAAAVLAACCAGCGKDTSFERYTPSEARARQALEAALTTWKQGESPGHIELSPGAVELVDTGRQPGQRLRDFTILGEVPGDASRCFAVRLQLDDPPEEKRMRFVVVGLDPVWVFRYQDFEILTHWGQCVEEDKSRDSTTFKAR
jgi:hypothetical protein